MVPPIPTKVGSVIFEYRSPQYADNYNFDQMVTDGMILIKVLEFFNELLLSN